MEGHGEDHVEGHGEDPWGRANLKQESEGREGALFREVILWEESTMVPSPYWYKEICIPRSLHVCRKTNHSEGGGGGGEFVHAL